ncbi:MAG: hypothetical protein CMO26_24125 [Thiotrichales bacterium]|nr:hypothetical protein [Thiotrichales bacterium]|tara:strand:- start:315 stop:1055 length:741 start_codon:yes stop_codon:yes gene_type:complete
MTLNEQQPSQAVTVLVFIPTYNDFELLGDITRSVSALGSHYTPMVVDDGSDQEISPEQLAPDSLCFRMPANFGLGTVTHVAFDHAIRHNYDVVVRVDADGQHPIEMIPELVSAISSGDADLVVGVRTNRHDGNGMRSLFARWVRGYLTVVAKLMSGGKAPEDVNSGIFAANSRAIRILNNAELEQFPEPQMYVLAARRGLKLESIPVQQMERKYGSSTVTIGHALQLFYRFNIFALAELVQRSRPT